MSARDEIFGRVRDAVSVLKEKTAYPEYESEDFHSKLIKEATDVELTFEAQFNAVHGMVMSSLEELKALLEKEKVAKICCDPKLHDHFAGLGIPLQDHFDRANSDECLAGITQGSGAIAESGTVILKDRDTFDRMAALAPWIHIAVVKRADILRTLPDAVAKLGDDPNVIWVTGPSKTADVEGILIEGVHGPGIQIAYLV